MWSAEPLVLQPTNYNFLELYFSTLKIRFFSHVEGVKHEEQAIPYAHVLTNNKQIKSKMERGI